MRKIGAVIDARCGVYAVQKKADCTAVSVPLVCWEENVGNRDSYTLGTMCMFDSCMCLGVCASLVVWSLTLLLDDSVSDSLLALVLAWGTGCSPGDKDGYIQQVVQHAEP